MPCVGEDRKFTPNLYIHSFFLPFLPLSSYNCNGWLGVKHQVTYFLPSFILHSFTYPQVTEQFGYSFILKILSFRLFSNKTCLCLEQSPIYVNTRFWCVWTGNMYRRGARRWRKLYVYNGHSYQAKRFSRVRIFWLAVFVVVLSLMSFWSATKYVERFYLKPFEYYCVSKHLRWMNVLVFGPMQNPACKKYGSVEINSVYGYIISKCMFLQLQISIYPVFLFCSRFGVTYNYMLLPS